MDILVTGGAGYIGSILVEQMIDRGHRVIVLDNLSRGHRAAVARGASFIKADLGDCHELDYIFQQNKVDAVMHLAACTSVEQSMKEPGMYFRNNVSCGINLLDSMIKHGINKIVFSSSAAVYGEPKTAPVNEESPPNPVNAYGDSKFVFERILGWYGEIHGLKYISLRYFNVAGASKHLGACHHPETNLIPVVIKAALGDIEYLPVLGNDYNTRDGTCIRDYISVLDIARAHILALYCLSEEPGNRVCNLGNGEGFSVMEVIETARKVTGAAIPVKICPRRQGDPAVLIADYRRAKEYFGWEPENSSLEDIIRSAWLWQKEHPQGYGDAR